MTFFVFLRNEVIFVATLDVKGGWLGVSDSNVKCGVWQLEYGCPPLKISPKLLLFILNLLDCILKKIKQIFKEI